MAKGHSRRARRMERHHRNKNQGGLNLVSLMDIFTILVFFLLVNSSSTPQLPTNKALKLPSATTEKAPEETILVVITKKDILVQGRKVASVKKVLKSDEETIEGLAKELAFLDGESKKRDGNQDIEPKKITIMGDRSRSYGLIRKVLNTCQQANYTNIAFAATQVAKKS